MLRRNLETFVGLVVVSIVFLMEAQSPSGVFLACGYVVAVVATLYAKHRFTTYVVSVAAMIACIFSLYFMHTETDRLVNFINHGCAILGILLSTYFITRTKQNQKNTISYSLQMNSLFTNATEGIILSNRAGQIALINPVAERMFGYDKGELIGQNIDVLLPMKFQQKHEAHRNSFHEKPVNRTMGAGRDLFAKRKDNSEFPVEISLSHYKQNKEAFVIAFVIDITIRKANEKALVEQRQQLESISQEIKLLNTQLEQKVADRTTMLRETLAQLEVSKDELAEALEKEKELSDLKTRFVSTVSHEFRTPLSAVLSSAALIARYETTEQNDKRIKHIDRIKENVKHLNDMLGDLLSLGKLEEGLIEACASPFSGLQFMRDFVAEMQEICGKQQQIVLKYDGEEIVCLDKRLLKNTLINLVSNAIKFSPEDGVISLVVKNSPEHLEVEVQDQGIGISEEDQQHLFERFFRARNAQNIQGTGLGLHIVSRYLELLKGSISLSSQLNKGSQFKIIIPNTTPNL
jgi:PAS domain S-box-containing protein